ncbi:MAG: SlyX family protein [Pseudomonadota bacterium]
MDIPHPIDQRLTALEIKASFTEDLVEQLNQVIIRQQTQIDALIFEIQRLREHSRDAGAGPSGSPRDELPPHY